MYVRASLRRTYIPRYTSTETTPNGSAHFFNFNTCELVIQTKHLNQMPHRQPFFNKTKCAAGNYMLLRGGNFRSKNVFGCQICQNLPSRGSILFASTEKVHRPRSDSPLHIDIKNIWQICTAKTKMSALSVCFPQTCSSAGCRFAASRSRLHYYRRIVSLPQQRI